MGTNVYLMRSDHTEVEDWDSSGHGGGRDLALAPLPRKVISWEPESDWGDIFLVRPTDFEVWRRYIQHLPNSDHWLDLMDRVEKDAELWIWFSR